ISPEKAALIKELLDLSGGKNSVDSVDSILELQRDQASRMITSMIDADKTMLPADKEAAKQMTTEMVTRTMHRMQKFFKEEVDLEKITAEVVTPIFDKNFTEAELRELIAFNRTPVAQKSARLMPQLMIETMTALSEKLFPRIQDFLTKTVDSELAL